ncbi:MAG: SWIM zinc finger family protein [Prevotellaceae bacterium]|jgi:hypothetical protein|nr:SWIM zinc finger family protein [Prevotellaceae bacterium]
MDSNLKGRDLVEKNKFFNLRISEDGSLIWGECTGSSANPYFCYADYIDKNKPVFQCNCLSKQFPCKHNIGLLYAFEKGLQFTVAEIPDEIKEKRNKITKHTENKVQEKLDIEKKATIQNNKPKNVKSIIKKIEIQLFGIEIAKKLLQNIVQMGLSGIDATIRKTIVEQIQELGNYHIEGIQLAFNSLLVELDYVKDDEYTFVINQLNYISALLKKSKEYLAAKKENPESDPELTSAIEEQIGYIWKLTDLQKHGLYEENAEIIQLSFNSYDNVGRKALVDEGYWFNLRSGKIYKSKNYRPYKALKYIMEENSCFVILQIPKLFIYPGDLNPRVRWGSQKLRLITDEDRTKIINCSLSDYAEVVKTAKFIIKNPLADKNPVMLLRLNKAYIAGKHIVLEDKQGNKLTIVDLPEQQICTEIILKSILPEKCENIVLTAMINNNVKTNMLSITALSLILYDRIIRLLY